MPMTNDELALATQTDLQALHAAYPDDDNVHRLHHKLTSIAFRTHAAGLLTDEGMTALGLSTGGAHTEDDSGGTPKDPPGGGGHPQN